jgi:hypothetical protein
LNIVKYEGFKKPPGGEIGSNFHALNGHTYCCMMSPTVCKSGEPAAGSEKACANFHKQRIGQSKTEADRLGIPLFLSEFGACLDTDSCAREINQVADACE